MLAATSLRAITLRWLELYESEARETMQASFGGSQQLRALLEAGAAADVFASADVTHIEALARAGICAPWQPLAGNRLALVAPASRRIAAGTSSETEGPQLERSWDAAIHEANRIAIGAPRSPIGDYTQQWLGRIAARQPSDGQALREHFERVVVSRDPNVGQIVARLLADEVDLAVIYESDAHQLGAQVHRYPLPGELQIATRYGIALVRASSRTKSAEAFIDFVLSDRGQAELASVGLLRADAVPDGATDTR